MKIEVNGVQVEVGKEFADLSPEKQQAVVEEIAASLTPTQQPVEERGEPMTVSEMWPTLGGAAIGATTGKRLGQAAQTGVEAARATLRPQGAGGEKWLRNWAGMNRPGVQGVPEASQIYERAKTHGKAGEKVWKKFGDRPLDVGRQAEMAAQQRRAGSLPGQIVSGAKEAGKALVKPTPYRFLGGALAGGLTGYDAARAWNRLQEGDIPGAAISGIGAFGGALSFIPHPITRIGGGAIAGGAALADFLRNRDEEEKEKQYSDVSESPAWQGYRAGGLAYMADGGSAPKGGSPKKRVAEFVIGRAPRAIEKIKQEAMPLWQRFGYDPNKVGSQYPDVAPPVMTTDVKTGKTFSQKQLSEEAQAVQKARQAAQKEIDKGMMESPFFDISKRAYVDPANYPLPGRTLTSQVPKKAETVEKYRALAESPEATQRLLSAYRQGSQAPMAKDWYAMKQLEDEFIKELGPEAGRAAFRQRFAEPMAATTGGADPTSNLMMTAYSNYMDTAGKTLPTAAFELPFPVGGRFVSGNMEQANKYRQMGSIPIDNPKRHNFASNFMGYRDRPTIDEQMMGLFAPGKGAPEPGTYGVYEAALNKLAAQEGVNPVNFQDVAWAGAKNYQGKPMMQEINEMIYRTSRVTGQSPEEVLRGFIRGNKPMYGVTGLGVLGMEETEGVNNPN